MKPAMRSILIFFFFISSNLTAQVTAADYRRALEQRAKYQGLAIDVPGPANWIEGTERFWYEKSVRGGREFELVDAETLTKGPAFDHEKLAAALSAASGRHYEPLALPFSEFKFIDAGRAIEFSI